MADVVARSHGGDGGNEPPRGPPRQIGSNCQRSKSNDPTKKVRGPTKNTALKKKVSDDGRPVSIGFQLNAKGTYEHVGPHASWFSNYVGELLRESIPMYYDSWDKVPETDKAHIDDQLHHFFDLDEHLAGENGEAIVASIEAYLKKQYDDNKYKFKLKNFTRLGGVEKVDEIKNQRPTNKTQQEWDEQLHFWIDTL